MGEARPTVAVVGSANVDLSIGVERLPAPGETVLGDRAQRGGGGKGANQAVAAARLGASVALIGRVGGDDDGSWLRERLDADGVDTSHLRVTEGAATGLAVVLVDRQAENSIVVSSGANRLVTEDDVEAAASVLAGADVVLTQWETPPRLGRVLRSLTPGRIVLNPAPAAGRAEDVGDIDVIVPNRGELAALVGADADPDPDRSTVADQALALDAPAVVVTLGDQGAMVVLRGGGGHAPTVTAVPAVAVEAVDTTAAGDAFCGGLAVALGEGASVIDATRWAVRVAGAAVTARGAQDSLARRTDVGSWRTAPT